MEDTIGLNEGDMISPDFSGLESSLNSLIESIQTDLESRENEKLEQKEKEEKQNEVDLSNEENLLEVQANQESYQVDLLSTEEAQAADLNLLVTEIQTLNENTLLQMEKMDNQNFLIVESSLTLVITIVIVAAVKIFIDQITKW